MHKARGGLLNKAQASLEYFIIFAVIAGLTLLSVSTFLNRTRTSSQNLYSKAVARILNSQALTSPPTPTSTPAPTSTPPCDDCIKLNQIAPGSGDFYGGTISIAAGEVKRYILPLGEVYLGQNLMRLVVKSAALIDGTGQVSVKLTSPDITPWSTSGSSSTADFTFNAIAQSYPMGANYPATYLNNGYWILEITGVLSSQLKLWWKCY